MYREGLNAADLRKFHAALRAHHSMRVRVMVLDLNHERLADLSDQLLDGQVDIDADADVTRRASISFLDERRTMDFDSDSPSDGALFANRMLRIVYSVRVDDLNEWVNVPIFTGPIVKLDRADDVVNVECLGKEHLAMGAAWRPMTLKKGKPKVDAIRQIMRERGGESRFDLPDLKARLPKSVSLGRASSPWQVSKRIAKSMDRQLYYDGAGRLRLRVFPGNDVFTFSDGDGGEVMSPPQVAFSIENVANVVWVKGGKPRAKRRENETRDEFEERQEKERGIRHHEVAPRAHPLSPWRLGRDDAPRFLLEVVENDHIRSAKTARRIANRVLRRRLAQAVDVTFDSLVVPHLDPEDLVRVHTDDFGQVFRFAQGSIPLRHDGLMSVGYIKRVSMSRRRSRRRGRGRR